MNVTRRERRCAACVVWRGEPLGGQRDRMGDEMIEGRSMQKCGFRSCIRNSQI